MRHISRALIITCLTVAFWRFNAFADNEWQTLKDFNFIIYYRSDVPEDFVKTVMASTQETFDVVTDNLGINRYQNWSGDQRAKIYIYRDKNDYMQKGDHADWSHGISLVQTKTIKTYPADQGFFDSLLPHELGHIIFRGFVGPYADVPLWFDEGLAMYQEKARRVSTNKIVQEALEKGQFIPLTQLTDMRLYKNSDRSTVDLFYAESASIVNFMITELGQAHFRELCQQLKGRRRFEEVLPKVYTHISDLNDLNRKWVNYLKGH